jgi:hypothetical protein
VHSVTALRSDEPRPARHGVMVTRGMRAAAQMGVMLPTDLVGMFGMVFD